MSEHLHMLMTVDKCALLMIFFHGSFYLNCCHVKKMTLIGFLLKVLLSPVFIVSTYSISKTFREDDHTYLIRMERLDNKVEF